jgi:hypothetical protein
MIIYPQIIPLYEYFVVQYYLNDSNQDELIEFDQFDNHSKQKKMF